MSAQLVVDGRAVPVSAVLLDIDDTLVDTTAGFAAGIDAVARRWLPHLPAADRPQVLAAWRRDVGGHFRQYQLGRLGFQEQRRGRASQLHEQFGGPVLDDDGFRAWNDCYGAAFDAALRRHDDVVPLLEHLAGLGVPVQIVTNAGVGHQQGKLQTLGLGRLAPDLVGVDTLGFGKPDRRVFHEGCRRVGVTPASAIYIGDQRAVDAEGARDAGLVGVWLDRERPGLVGWASDEVLEIGDLTGLVPAIRVADLGADHRAGTV